KMRLLRIISAGYLPERLFGFFSGQARDSVPKKCDRPLSCFSQLAIPHINRFNLYSYLNASIGSKRAAFIAGHIPNTSPIPQETVIPAIGAQVGTYTGRIRFTNRLNPHPMAIPSSPPEPVKDIASIRHWRRMSRLR